MLLLTSEELKELNKNLNAFEKFLQDLPDKALLLVSVFCSPLSFF